MASAEKQVSKESPEAKRREEQEKKAPKLLVFPTKEQPHSILLVFKKYKYAKWADSKRELLSASTGRGGRGRNVELDGTVGIQLPFPKQLTDSNDIRISSFERNALVEAAMSNEKIKSFLTGEGTLSDFGSALKDMGVGVFNAAKGVGEYVSGSDGSKMLNDAGDLLAGMKDARMSGTAGAAYLLRSQLGNIPGMGGTGISTLNAALGQVVNPRETLTFEGVGLRSHSFEWELYPSNKNDSEMIRKIVATVKRNTLPSTSEFAGIPRVLLNFPSTVDMYLLGVNPDHFIKFKTCMVASTSVNYSAGGGITAIAKGGVPAAVSLSMSFQELDIETADDYESGLLPDEIGEAVEADGSSGAGTAGEQNSGGSE